MSEDFRKIAIVAKVSDEAGAERLAGEIGRLSVPEGYVATTLIYKSEELGLASVYNIADREYSADIYVYIYEGARLGSTAILEEIVSAFAADESLLMVGATGVRQLPTNADIFTAKKLVGGDAAAAATAAEAQVLAPGVVGTRGGLRWRETLVTGDGLAVEAMSIECKKCGTIGVARQAQPWIAHLTPPAIAAADKDRFLAEYSRELYPLVSVVIPTYDRPEYLAEALDSVLNQTYRNIEIFITDNSHNTRTRDMMRARYAGDSRITYEHHPDFDANGNFERAWEYNNPRAEFINMLMDDDLFMPRKLEVMVQQYMDNPDVTLVSSNRRCIDAAGNTIAKPHYVTEVAKDTRLERRYLGREMLARGTNPLGEPTTVLVRKSDLVDNYYGWDRLPTTYRYTDFPTWLGLLTKGDAVILAEELSAFRLHAGQESNDLTIRIRGAICWAMELYHAGEKLEFFDSEADYRAVVTAYVAKTLAELANLVKNNIITSDTLRLHAELGRLLERIRTDEA